MDRDRATAFDRLYRDTFRRVMSYCCWRCRNRADADDATSETYLVAWRRLSEVLDADSQIAWLCGVASRVVSNQRRRHRRDTRLRAKLEGEAASLDVPGSSSSCDPADAVVSLARLHAVCEALDSLPGLEREIVRLSVFEHLTYGDIARRLGVRVGTVRSRLYRARRHLRQAGNQ